MNYYDELKTTRELFLRECRKSPKVGKVELLKLSELCANYLAVRDKSLGVELFDDVNYLGVCNY